MSIFQIELESYTKSIFKIESILNAMLSIEHVIQYCYSITMMFIEIRVDINIYSNTATETIYGALMYINRVLALDIAGDQILARDNIV